MGVKNIKKFFPKEIKTILRQISTLSYAEKERIYSDLESRYGAGGVDIHEFRRYFWERHQDRNDKIDEEEIDNILEKFNIDNP